MLVLESLLLTVLIGVFVIACYTDCRTSIIENKTLFFAGSIILILDIVYYVFFAKEYTIAFMLNLIFLVIIAMIFYGYHLWAAGDSKLLILVGLAIPGRIYTLGNFGYLASFATPNDTFTRLLPYQLTVFVKLSDCSNGLFFL